MLNQSWLDVSLNKGENPEAGDYRNQTKQAGFMSLSEEDQLVLERAHWEMAQNLEWSGRRVSVLLDATHFSLTPEEKSSIESDILAKKPIHDAPAYRKLLGLCFPGEEITFPYLPNLDDARIVVSKLSQLFGKTVRFPTLDEALESLKENNHVTGYHRADTDAEFIELLGEAGYAWISNENIFQYVSYYPDQRSRLYIGNPNDGYSLIPVFDN